MLQPIHSTRFYSFLATIKELPIISRATLLLSNTYWMIYNFATRIVSRAIKTSSLVGITNRVKLHRNPDMTTFLDVRRANYSISVMVTQVL